jgi:hypothetical protein
LRRKRSRSRAGDAINLIVGRGRLGYVVMIIHVIVVGVMILEKGIRRVVLWRGRLRKIVGRAHNGSKSRRVRKRIISGGRRSRARNELRREKICACREGISGKSYVFPWRLRRSREFRRCKIRKYGLNRLYWLFGW